MKTFAFLIICLAVRAEPATIAEKRKVYLRELQKLESVHQQKVKKLTWRYVHELNKLKVASTKVGNLEDALAVKAEIDKLKGALAQDEQLAASTDPKGRWIREVVLHQTTNGRYRNAGVKSGKVLWYYGTPKESDKKFKQFKLKWVPGKSDHTTVSIQAMRRITKIRIECSADKSIAHVGLAEVEIFDRSGRNIAAEAHIEVISTNPVHRASALVDGAVDANAINEANWHANEQHKDGWVEFTWSK